jgi:hypothetical protein
MLKIELSYLLSASNHLKKINERLETVAKLSSLPSVMIRYVTFLSQKNF